MYQWAMISRGYISMEFDLPVHGSGVVEKLSVRQPYTLLCRRSKEEAGRTASPAEYRHKQRDSRVLISILSLSFSIGT